MAPWVFFYVKSLSSTLFIQSSRGTSVPGWEIANNLFDIPHKESSRSTKLYLFIYLFIRSVASIYAHTPLRTAEILEKDIFCIPEFNVTISRYIGVFVFVFPSSFIILSTDYKKRYSGATDERLISLANLLIRKHKDVDTDDKL